MTTDLKNYFADKFEYHSMINQKLGEYMLSHGDKVPAKCIELFSHYTMAQAYWQSLLLKNGFRDFKTSTIEGSMERDLKNQIDLTEIFSKFELDERITTKK